MAIEKKSKSWGPFWSYQLNSNCQFGCGISKMVGPKKQAFCPRINILKGNFDTNYFEPLRLEKLLHTSDLFLFFLSCQTFIIEWWRKRLKKKDNIEHFLECHVRWFIPFFSLDSERYLIKYWQFRKTRLSLCKKYFLELTLKTPSVGNQPIS